VVINRSNEDARILVDRFPLLQATSLIDGDLSDLDEVLTEALTIDGAAAQRRDWRAMTLGGDERGPRRFYDMLMELAG